MTEETPTTLEKVHRFLDEAGDTTFFGKGGRLLLGTEGVSSAFAMGIVTINADLEKTRREVCALQKEIEQDELLNVIPSVAKKIQRGGFHFHATDDPPEVRERFVRFLKKLDCAVEIMVARKVPSIYAAKHNHRETEFYADVLSHLIRPQLGRPRRLVLNIAERGNSTRNVVLQAALAKADVRMDPSEAHSEKLGDVIFNVQNPKTEPLLNVADYLCWAVQRVFERGETRYYNFLKDRIKLVVDLYDVRQAVSAENCYSPDRPLRPENKLGPPTA